MFKIEGRTIHCTRGDTGTIDISANLDEETKYVFKVGDIVRFKVFGKKKPENVVLCKSIEVLEETEKVSISLLKGETKFEDLIKKQKEYWYEVELNPDTVPQTIIGYDDINGAAQFILYPEGGDIEC